MRTTTVEPLEQRVCLSAGQAVHFQFAYATTQRVERAHVHHHFTAMSWGESRVSTAPMGGGMMMKMGVPAGQTWAAPAAMEQAIAKALEQLARQMMKEMQQGEAGEKYSGIKKNSAPQPDADDAGESYVISNPEPVKPDGQVSTGTIYTNPPAANQTTQSNVIVTASVRPIETRNVAVATVAPKARVAAVETGGRAIEILETTSTVATRAVTTSAATVVSLGSHATTAARELWTIVTGGGETKVDSVPAGAMLGAANPAVAVAAKAAVAVVPNVTVPKMFEFAHLGSPMTLLADSMAGFIEDSAGIAVATSVVSSAQSQMPWLITATVIAADIVLLTYMHKRRSKRATITG